VQGPAACPEGAGLVVRRQIASLGRNAAVYGTGTVLTRLIGLFLLPVFTAYLTPAEFGVMAMLTVIGQLLQPIFALGLGAGIGPTYFEGNDEGRKSATIWTATLLIAAGGVAMVALSLPTAGRISDWIFDTPENGPRIVLYLAGMALNSLISPLMLRTQFENRVVPFVTLTIATTLVSLGASLYLVVFRGLGLDGMILGQLAGHAVAALLWTWFVGRSMRFEFRRSLARELFVSGSVLAPSFIFLFVLLHANKYLLQRMSGLDSLGVYSIGFSLGFVMQVVVGAIQTAWYPFFMTYMNRQEEAGALFGRIMTYYVVAAGALVLLFFAAARPVVAILTQPEFHEAYKVVGLVAGSQFLSGAFSLLLPGLYFSREVHFVSIFQGCAALALVVLCFVLIPPLEALGAALALFLGSGVMVLMIALWFRAWPSRYLRVCYEPRRLLLAGTLYVGAAVLLMVPYTASLAAYLSVATAAMVVIPGIALLLLNRGERAALGQWICSRGRSLSAGEGG
jgi:O-antigen/teichoic acid export membrane protein